MTVIKSLFFLLSFALLIGCTNGKPKEVLSPRETDAINQLAWIMDFDVEHALKRALENRDFRLYAKASRQPQLFGIAQEDKADLVSKCGFQFAEGYGDVIYGEAHRKLRNKAALLLSEYNQKVRDMCLNQ